MRAQGAKRFAPHDYRFMRPRFRFEDVEIWQLAKQLDVQFHSLADQLDECKFFRYAEQLRATGLPLIIEDYDNPSGKITTFSRCLK